MGIVMQATRPTTHSADRLARRSVPSAPTGGAPRTEPDFGLSTRASLSQRSQFAVVFKLAIWPGP